MSGAPTGHHAPIDYHVALLSDPWRTAGWARAIQALTGPSTRVLDVGTGLGAFAVLAARRGASVTAVESAWVAELARQTIERAGLTQQIALHAADLAALTPHPVDVVLCDFIGRLLPDAAMLRAVRASAAWMAPNARFAPSRVDLFAAPVVDVALPALDRLREPLLGVDLSAALPAAWSTAWAVHLDPAACLAPAAPLATLTPPDVPEAVRAEVRVTADRAALLRGFAGWFSAELAPGVRLDTGPGRRTFWGQTLWPAPATPIEPGDVLTLSWHGRSLADGVGMTWHILVERQGRCILDHRGDTTARPTPGPPPPSAPRSPHDLLRAGAVDLAAPELLLRAPTDRAAAEDLVLALVQRGEQTAAAEALDDYERRFGPHPTARRAPPEG